MSPENRFTLFGIMLWSCCVECRQQTHFELLIGQIAARTRRRIAPPGFPVAAGYWKAVSEKLLSLRECRRSIGISASFSIALMPMVRCCATCRL